ncbi:MAG: cytochrome c peroxidase [Pseudomonadota bacterium]
MTHKTALSLIAILAAGTALASPFPDPITDADYAPVDEAEARLGQLLFYDPILSGNRNVSCGTCHHPAFGTGDGLSLGIGDGGIGLGPDRVADPGNMPEQRIPRNAPGLWNLGAKEFTVLFHDGRIEVDPNRPGGLRTPLDADMTTGFASLLSAQTMFPVLSADEMAGHYGENDVSLAVRRGVITGDGGAWDIIARRVAAISAYADDFMAVYDHIDHPNQIAFTDISNAVAAFMEFEWRSDTAPFDAVLRGERDLPEPAATGMTLFYGEAGCASCHSGAFQTDHQFHAMGAPQIGPGKAARFESHARDEGRFRVTGNADDLYAFRTPSLRNVALTGPYGHAGAHSDLRDFVVAHLDPVAALAHYNLASATLPDLPVTDDADLANPAIVEAVSFAPVQIGEDEIDALIAFLDALTDPVAAEGRLGVPEAVPSGLPIDNPTE